jgi:hypothetical protein
MRRKGHYTGQKVDKETFAEFQKLSKQDQSTVASKVGQVRLHNSVRVAVDNLKARKSVKRRRK